MENYEKRYKAALERAKDMLSHKEVRQEDMEYLFPELKENENENERTMKELCKAIWTYIPYEQAQKYITWLEKQGEKKPTWKPTAAQLIVIKSLMEDKNTSNVDKTVLRGMFEEFKEVLTDCRDQHRPNILLTSAK